MIRLFCARSFPVRLRPARKKRRTSTTSQVGLSLGRSIHRIGPSSASLSHSRRGKNKGTRWTTDAGDVRNPFPRGRRRHKVGRVSVIPPFSTRSLHTTDRRANLRNRSRAAGGRRPRRWERCRSAGHCVAAPSRNDAAKIDRLTRNNETPAHSHDALESQ